MTRLSSSWPSPLRTGLLALAAGVTATAGSPAKRPDLPVWQRWEQVLTATVPPANPYADVTLRVRYTGPGGQTFASFGFWDGGATYRLRAAFPTPGTWHWETDCSDPTDTGLHRRRGTVEVASYRGDNPLYQHGFLRVADNRRHLAWADGTPYLWIGDTAWAGPHRATDADWDDAIEVDVSGFFSPLSARWFDPVRGRYAAHPEAIPPGGVRRLAAPAPGEWVLLLAGAAATRQGRPVAP